MKVSSIRLSVAFGMLLLLAPSVASAGTGSCLASDPAAVGDAAALDAVRIAVDAACPCASFNGDAGKKRGDYKRCAKGVLKPAIETGQLRKQCGALAAYPVAQSTCGYPAGQQRVPCLSTSGSGKVKCKISTTSSCEQSGKLDCPAYSNCLDAADTNQDHRVGSSDSGMCNLLVPCLNPPLPDGASCNDGVACTRDDICSAHACGGTVYACGAPSVCEEAGSCNGDGTCSYPAKPDGTTCDDGIDVRPPLTCDDGACGPCAAAGTCSITASRSCTVDGHCPSGETCVLGATAAPRFVDNRDGTITDRQSCLVWEKKVDHDGSPVACPGGATCDDPHDADNVYSWSSTGTARDGSAFTLLLGDLNDTTFAGHATWRLPVEIGLESPFTGPKELTGLVDAGASGCGSGAPCTAAAFFLNCTPTCSGTDPTCSCAATDDYWTDTADSGSVGSTRLIDFASGTPGSASATGNMHARAVRGGLYYQDCDAQETHNTALYQQYYEDCVDVFCENPDLDGFRCILGCISAYRTLPEAFVEPADQDCVADRGQRCDEIYDQALVDSCTAFQLQNCQSNCNPLYPICVESCMLMSDCERYAEDARAFCEQGNP